MSRERLELVTDFATLRAGMIVVYRPCQDCGGSHRGMLLRFYEGPMHDPSNRSVKFLDRGWILAPKTYCPPDDPSDDCIGTQAVSRGAVYRVIDGLEDEQTTTTTKKRERVK